MAEGCISDINLYVFRTNKMPLCFGCRSVESVRGLTACAGDWALRGGGNVTEEECRGQRVKCAPGITPPAQFVLRGGPSRSKIRLGSHGLFDNPQS